MVLKVRLVRNKHLANRVLVVFLVVIVVVLVLVSPVVVKLISGKKENWYLLSSVGQTYGFAAALLSGIALLGVAASIFYQNRQNSIAQLQASRTMQMELMRMAYEIPELQESWSKSINVSYSEWRKRTYMNLIFMYLRMGYVTRGTTDEGLHRMMANRFKGREGRDYWRSARMAFELDTSSLLEKKFFRITEQEYAAALEIPPLESNSGPNYRKNLVRWLLPVAAGGILSLVVSRLLRRVSLSGINLWYFAARLIEGSENH